MSDDALAAEAMRWVERVRVESLPEGFEGCYDVANDVIYLSDRLTSVQRRCVLAHEISHARHRDRGCNCDSFTERRADMEAANLLIDPLEYETAERIYEGNSCMMAVQLNVMPWIVNAYKARLDESVR